MRPLPGQPFPTIDLPRAGGGRVTNADFDAPFMTVLNVYRGLHCPRCKRQMGDFVSHRAVFDEAGLKVVSISTDSEERARKAVSEWGLGDMPVGHGLTVEQARGLGLFISETISDAEPQRFAEAGLFLIRPEGTLWGSVVNTFPFMRPTAEMVLDAAKMAREHSYPPRGNIAA